MSNVAMSYLRFSARQCLEHPWLANDDILVDLLHELETEWMRGCLARRRWHRALNALKAMHTMKKLTFPDIVPGKLDIVFVEIRNNFTTDDFRCRSRL